MIGIIIGVIGGLILGTVGTFIGIGLWLMKGFNW